ncbi:glycosyltransferase family 4 protein [Fulvivirga sediminis]|uniref:Glycosyltransferase family 4 protein n=1 Tax=Fulvivirga sediminis TaxID=2803949 RepID=A0A937FB62_9BACT|nr:glycosyltransferase family 4 protein [Fulvivirga sediminis]MBL3657258.1 glycosyltransferase family 4 protein [Fulvivirga sediminis]
MQTGSNAIFATFDPYPSYKGSAIHIEKVTELMASKFLKTLVVTLKQHTDKPLAPGLHHIEFDQDESNYLKRAQAYSKWLDDLLESEHQLEVGHFRDIWSGIPILKRPHITSIFEVNGLPSIELASRYPYIGESTIEKIKLLEGECLHKCQLIICPSETIKNHLIKRRVLANKIHVVSNGADIPVAMDRPTDLPPEYIVYFGALQPWQGVDVLLKAMQYLQDKPSLKLVICSSHKPKFARPFIKLAEKLLVSDQIVWKYQLHKDQLHQIIQHAICSVAPLTECSRNLEQGCSPLKIFESMACKTPVVASDLPVVREILQADKEVKLCRPGRPADLARCIRLMVDYPELRTELSENAFAKIISKYNWNSINRSLSMIYDNIFKLVF